jgi:hypothetical protein
MKREFEKFLGEKILEYQSNLKRKNNGIIPKSKSDLILGFYTYSLSHFIETMKDIPNKYQEIFAD